MVIDDQIQKQGLFLPGCKREILSKDAAVKWCKQKSAKKILFLLGVYMENEAKVMRECREKFAGFELEFYPLYTPSNLI